MSDFDPDLTSGEELVLYDPQNHPWSAAQAAGLSDLPPVGVRRQKQKEHDEELEAFLEDRYQSPHKKDMAHMFRAQRDRAERQLDPQLMAIIDEFDLGEDEPVPIVHNPLFDNARQNALGKLRSARNRKAAQRKLAYNRKIAQWKRSVNWAGKTKRDKATEKIARLIRPHVGTMNYHYVKGKRVPKGRSWTFDKSNEFKYAKWERPAKLREDEQAQQLKLFFELHPDAKLFRSKAAFYEDDDEKRAFKEFVKSLDTASTSGRGSEAYSNEQLSRMFYRVYDAKKALELSAQHEREQTDSIYYARKANDYQDYLVRKQNYRRYKK